MFVGSPQRLASAAALSVFAAAVATAAGRRAMRLAALGEVNDAMSSWIAAGVSP